MRPLDAFGPRSWCRPDAVAANRLPAAAPLRRDTEVALDGDWAFLLRDRPEAVTADDLTGSTDGWDVVEVPGCWTMQGFDRPHYTNVQMPFSGPPPRVPDENPTGVYRRRVTVPAAWSGRRVRLHVGGAETVLYVFVDGRPVGMGKDSRLPHEFDLTDLVDPGRSVEVALVVVRWSDATYLEDQDHWHHAGLHRSVRLAATPPVHLEDVRPTADFDPVSGVGRLDLRVEVGVAGAVPDGHSVRVDAVGTSVTVPVPVLAADASEFDALAYGGPVATATIEVSDVEPWSAERPRLHPVAVTLLDPAGAEVDDVSVDVGFRRVEVTDGELRVNGRPILVKGVNRHDHHERRGKAVSDADIEADLIAMKRHNVNAVRTSHYPNDAHLYDLCDRLGLYVVDEPNIESHAHLRSLTRDPRWGPALLERVTRMAVRDVGHPSVIAWSLGNESGSAPIHRAMAEWLRAFDPTRPIQYEGGLADDLFADLASGVIPDMAELLARPRPESDLVAPMYPEIDDIVRWAEAGAAGGPLVMCEYAHAMGNSCGGFDDYWAAIRSTPGLQGGFVWDWMDQALVQTLPDGTERLAYGGDFGDEPNDGAFCLNGLVASDRTPHPSLLEAAEVLSPVRIAPLADRLGAFSVHNEHAFIDLSWLQGAWSVAVDGIEAARGDLGVVPAGPGETVEVEVPATAPDVGAGERATVDVRFVTREATPWAPAGHVVASARSA
ncbi:MAG: glycoside hydrolase family 2 TIM barrel-domain containing protein [Actinomycetota bacterium]